MRPAILLLAAGLALFPVGAGAGEIDAPTVIERYLEARGGAELWRALDSLEITGTYAAFSFYEPFRLIRKRGDRYRLDYVVLESPAIRARGPEGAWGKDPLLFPEATRIVEDPYKAQYERESLFGLVLLDAGSRGIAVEVLGEGEVEGRPTVDLRLAFPDDREEIWHLDAETWLEVAVDSQVIDHTQGTTPMRRRTFYDDFREVGGLVVPFQVDHEFGARLEAMTIEQVRVNPELDAAEFTAPPPAAPDEEESGAPAGGDSTGGSEPGS